VAVAVAAAPTTMAATAPTNTPSWRAYVEGMVSPDCSYVSPVVATISLLQTMLNNTDDAGKQNVRANK
jgi:hypothetical protein